MVYDGLGVGILHLDNIMLGAGEGLPINLSTIDTNSTIRCAI